MLTFAVAGALIVYDATCTFCVPATTPLAITLAVAVADFVVSEVLVAVIIAVVFCVAAGAVYYFKYYSPVQAASGALAASGTIETTETNVSPEVGGRVARTAQSYPVSVLLPSELAEPPQGEGVFALGASPSYRGQVLARQCLGVSDDVAVAVARKRLGCARMNALEEDDLNLAFGE